MRPGFLFLSVWAVFMAHFASGAENPVQDSGEEFQAIQTALSTKEANDSLFWKNFNNGLYGEVIPISPLGANCRNYTRSLVREDVIFRWEGRACQEASGYWQVETESKSWKQQVNGSK